MEKILKNERGEIITKIYDVCPCCGTPVHYEIDLGVCYYDKGWCSDCKLKLFHSKKESVVYDHVDKHIKKIKVIFQHCSGIPYYDTETRSSTNEIVEEPKFKIDFYADFDYNFDKQPSWFGGENELSFTLNFKKYVNTIPSRKVFDNIANLSIKRAKYQEKKEILSNSNFMDKVYNDLVNFMSQFDFARTIGM